MNTMHYILGKKTQAIWSVAPDDTVYSAIQLMADKRIGALLVMDGKKLAGIISERDYAREVILKGRSSRETPVKQIMTTKIITVPSSCQVSEALELMTRHRIRHLPIVDKGTVTGIVSIGDLVKDMINFQQSTIEQLENYIRG
jgi:CBS domain-containing protein